MTTLKQLAINLESIAQSYAAQDIEVQKLLNSLGDMIHKAKNDVPIRTEEKVPGFYWFSEGELSKYKDLEQAYSQFSIFVAAGTSERYKSMLMAVDDALK